MSTDLTVVESKAVASPYVEQLSFDAPSLNGGLEYYVSLWAKARDGLGKLFVPIGISLIALSLEAFGAGYAGYGCAGLVLGSLPCIGRALENRAQRRKACPSDLHAIVLGDFFDKHGEDLKSLKDRVHQFNLAALEYQMMSCPLREQPERYAHIIAKLAVSREALVLECDEMDAYYRAALEPLRIRHEAKQPPPRPVPQISEEEQRRLAQVQRTQYLEHLERYLPVFEGGKQIGPNVTTDLSVHVALAVARQANDR